MNLDNLLAVLPVGPGTPINPGTTPPGCPRYIDQPLSRFVAPDLRLSSGSLENARVIVISAPGAVGKSTLAREIARLGRAPLWDLAADGPVARHTAIGALTNAYGPAQIGGVLSALATGGMFVAVDALDEARIKTNEASFDAFVRDVARIASAGSIANFVLLGRTQAAELTWLLLEDEHVPSAFLEIEMFDREKATRYIDLHITTTSPRAAKAIATHREPFETARDLIFDQLVASIDRTTNIAPSAIAADFTGYAPVLDAIAVFLGGGADDNVKNFSQVASELSLPATTSKDDAANSFGATRLLDGIVEAILKREQTQKLVLNIQPALLPLATQSGWNSWHVLYSMNEQIERLLGQLAQARQPFLIPGMPPQLQAAYESQVATWLPDHPFLRDNATAANAVFQSYVLAKSLVSGVQSARTTAERFLRSDRCMPTRLLADFYMRFLKQANVSAVPAQHIGILYESLSSADTDSSRLRMLVESAEADDGQADVLADVEFEFVKLSDQGADVTESYEFTSSVNANANITLRGALKEATIRVPCELCFAGSDDFRIGPNVAIQCQSLIIESRRLIVDTHSRRQGMDEGAVLIEAEAVVSEVAERPTVRGELQISWPGGNAYPWNEFYSPVDGPQFRSKALGAVYRRFRRIVMTLRSHSKGSLARYRHKIEHQRVLQGQLGVDLLRQLCDDKILRLDGRFYHWNPEQAAALVGISWADLRRRQTTATLNTYLECFLTAHPEHALA